MFIPAIDGQMFSTDGTGHLRMITDTDKFLKISARGVRVGMRDLQHFNQIKGIT